MMDFLYEIFRVQNLAGLLGLVRGFINGVFYLRFACGDERRLWITAFVDVVPESASGQSHQ